MKCNKLFKDSIGAIDFRYKLDDTVQELLDKQPNAKMTKDQFLGYLAGKGVSANEIKASGIQDWLSGYFGNTKGAKPVENFLRAIKEEGGHYIKGHIEDGFADITYKAQGLLDNSDYKAKILSTKYGSGIPQPHFSSPTNILGWNRVHTSVSEDGKKVLLLNEVQSDWSQKGRQKLKGYENFPMSEEKFQQLVVVDAIDEAISRGLNEIHIPIDRSVHGLAGTDSITKFYETMGNKTLPEIKRKLSKEGLMIDISKSQGSAYSRNITKEADKAIIDEHIRKLVHTANDMGDIDDMAMEAKSLVHYLDTLAVDPIPLPVQEDLINNIMDALQEYVEGDPLILYDYIGSITTQIRFIKDSRMWILKLGNVDKEKPIKWNIYSILPALGISKVTYDKLKKEESR